MPKEDAQYTYRQLEEAIAAAGAAAEDESLPPDVRARARQDAETMAEMATTGNYRDDTNPAASFALGASQGLTMGLGDEMWAGARAGFDKMLGRMTRQQVDFGEAYAKRLDENRRALADARREDPWLMGTGEVAGGLGTGALGIGRAVVGRGLLGAMGAGARTGAGLGALAGYGYSEGDPVAAAAFSEDPEAWQREGAQALTDVAVGGGMGAALGSTFPALGLGLKKAFNKAFIGKETRVNEMNRRFVMDALQKDVDSGHTTWRKIEQSLADDPNMVLGDMGPYTRELMENVMHSGTEAGTSLRHFVKSRNAEQWKRLHPHLAEALGTKGKTFSEAEKLLLNDAAKNGKRLYGIAYENPVKITPAMRNWLQADDFKNVPAQASRLMRQELIDEGADANVVKAMNIDIDSPTFGTRDVDYILRLMDSRVNDLFRAKKSSMRSRAISAKSLRDQFREEVYRQNSDLKVARESWSGAMATNDAMKRGKNIFNEDFEAIGDITEAFKSQGDMVGFRIGVAKAIVDKLGRKSFDQDLMKGIFDRPAALQAIEAAFGSKEKFAAFMRYVARENDMFETYRRSMGSETAKRLQTPDIWDQAAKVGGYGLGLTFGGGIPPSLAGWGAQRVAQNARRALSPVSADKLLQSQKDLLMSRNIGALRPTVTQQMLSPGTPMFGGMAPGAVISSGLFRPGLQYGDLIDEEQQ